MVKTGPLIIVRKNSGASDVGVEPRLNFIEGSNISLTITDSNGEIQITIDSSTTGTGADNNLLIMNLGGWKA